MCVTVTEYASLMVLSESICFEGRHLGLDCVCRCVGVVIGIQLVVSEAAVGFMWIYGWVAWFFYHESCRSFVIGASVWSWEKGAWVNTIEDIILWKLLIVLFNFLLLINSLVIKKEISRKTYYLEIIMGIELLLRPKVVQFT